MTANDIEAVLELERESPAAPHWSRETYEACAGEQSGSLRHFGLVAETADQIVGFGVVRHLVVEPRAGVPADNECEIESIVVSFGYRRQGIGSRLLAAVITEAKTLRAGRLLLEVRESNLAAIRLYQRSGLDAEGRRPAYYADPVEDAVLMAMDLNRETGR